MNSEAYRRLTAGLVIVVFALGLLSGWLFWKRTWLAVEVAFATEQTKIFDDMYTKALAISNPVEIAGYLDYAVGYYPSGTKQRTGSQLDEIVERSRANSIREIIAHLRSRTGQDLGDDPRKWIDQYAPRASSRH